MGALSPDRHEQQRDGSATPLRQPPMRHRHYFSLFFQWFLVACFGLSLIFLLQLHSPGPLTPTPVDQISCNQGEQLAFHIHAHLSIFVNGQAVIVPSAIGIASGGCLYWLHTHTPDGIIHMEAPHVESFVLGDFLDIWKQRSSQFNYPNALDVITGWQTFVDGQPVAGNFRAIPLKAHTLITLAYRSPGVQPDRFYNWGDL